MRDNASGRISCSPSIYAISHSQKRDVGFRGRWYVRCIFIGRLGAAIFVRSVIRIQDRLQDLELASSKSKTTSHNEITTPEEIMDAIEAKWVREWSPPTGQENTINEIQGSVSHKETELEELSVEV